MSDPFTRCTWSLMLAAALAACGGGGSDADASPAAAPPLAASPPSGAALWTPAVTDTWHWQLKGTIDTSIAATVYDIDLFDAPQATIDALKAQGRRVVCYFSAGSSENWRSDFARFAADDMGNPLDNWPGERWLDTRSANVREIMKARLDLAVTKQCDGVEPDNMDGYQNGSGFELDADTPLDHPRPAEQRVVGTCRHYAVLATAQAHGGGRGHQGLSGQP